MMTLDEAITHAEWCADNSCGECAEEHRQLAEWLKELRDIRSENAKLRSERDHWHIEQVHAYSNWEDTHKYAAKLKAENNSMRKFIQSYVDDYVHDNCGSCYGGLCEDCDCWLSNSVDELHALGIEVE